MKMLKCRIVVVVCGLLPFVAMAGLFSHKHQFNPDPKIGTMEQHKLKGKTLALDFSGVPESYKAKAAGHSFEITGIRRHTEVVARKVFANEKTVDDASKADYQLKLALQLKLEGAAFGTRCTADATWEIYKGGKLVSTGKGNDTASFPTTSNGGRNCEIVTLKAMPAALDDALTKL